MNQENNMPEQPNSEKKPDRQPDPKGSTPQDQKSPSKPHKEPEPTAIDEPGDVDGMDQPPFAEP
jgi:hypothetical protein